ncbi:MAG: competence/damage-inducible protein A [bacterium]
MLKTAETITVGSELTRGLGVDTHSALLARALEGVGLRVRFQTSVGDVLDDIVEAVALALKRADCVVVTGGLGPTLDDLTREAVAKAVGRPLDEDAALWKSIQERFAASGRAATDNNRRQAAVIQGSVSLANDLGSAPGFRMELDGRVLFALPGPPGELEALLNGSVLPWLGERQGLHTARRLLNVHGLGESAVDTALRPLVAQGDSTSLAMLAKGDHVELILTAVEPDQVRADAKAETLESAVLDVLGERVYSMDGRSLAAVVINLLKEQRLTLAVAESCTGGGVAARLCAVPGASEVFWGGVIAYTEESKQILLEVPPFVLKKVGAVSKDTALAMAVGLARKLDADYSLAITGIAGPGGGSAAKPVGTVHFALAGPAGVIHQSALFLNSDRQGVQARAVQAALWLVYASLAGLDISDKAEDRGALTPPKARG